ncbi:MAG: hypothetical protein GY708_27145 [Actinomycetia bacterium]|nr:hypothetical protein [Actinomycetes bacterium]MCP4962655.1 hypothetical protein [Actinomycetes bacterium]
MTNIDLKKVHRDHYSAKTSPAIVDVPDHNYLMIDGAGDPNTATEYTDAITSLYPIAYGLRAAIKDATGDAYTVMPLEGLWWTPDMADFDPNDKANWLWTAMICLPDAVTDEMAAEVFAAVTSKKKLAAGHKARVETYSEGQAAQVMYVGSYSEEGPSIMALHDFIAESGGTLSGKHHEIYLSDPRKTEPDRLKTIIRQPFDRA